LTLKPKGKRNNWTTVKDVNVYRELIEYAFSKNVQLGFDSCSAKSFLVSTKNHPHFDQFCIMVESCEATLFSGYANVLGHFYPCSFTENEQGWEEGIDLLSINDFNDEVWNHQKVVAFRKANIETEDPDLVFCRECVTFPNLYDPTIMKKIIKIHPIN
jgi:hypothetical protein